MIRLQLPWPPSINGAKFYVNNRPVTTKKVKDYKKAVAAEVLRNPRAQSLGAVRLEVHIQAFPPDRHKRDLDNIQKVLLDALQASGLFDDDEQIDYLSILRAPRLSEGMVLVQKSQKKNGKENDKTKEKKD